MGNVRRFASTPAVTAAMQPWVGPSDLCLSGIFLGRNLRTHRTVRFDPWLMKAAGVIDSPLVLVTGNKGGGKSTWGKTVAARLMARQAGLDATGYPQHMRVWLHNRKPEAGASEMEPLTRFLDSKVVALNRSRSINIFDPTLGMTENDMLEVAVNVCEFGGSQLQRHQKLALQVAMSKMMRGARQLVSLEMLEATTRGLNLQDVDDYFAVNNHTVRAAFKSLIVERPELEHQLNLTFERPHNLPERDFLDDAAQVATYLAAVLWGDFGGIFGGHGSLRNTLSRPVLSLDWSGVSDNARSLLDAMLLKWQTVALNNNDLDLIPHINLGDEEHEAVRSLMHMRFWSAYVKKARAFHTFDVRITQRVADISMAGESGSEIRSLAKGIVDGIGFRVMFRQPNSDESRHELALMGISDQDIDYLVHMGLADEEGRNETKGLAAIYVPGRPIILYRHLITQREAAFVGTDSANDRMLNLRPVTDFSDWKA